MITLSKDISGRITVTFPYNPLRVEKVRTIPGRKWHPSHPVIASPDEIGTTKQSHIESRHSELVSESRTSPITLHDFEDLRRELVSRKYSKTTEIYTHVSTRRLGQIVSPLDTLSLKEGGDK